MTERSAQLLLGISFCWLLFALPSAAMSQDRSPDWSLQLTVEPGRGDAEEFIEGSHEDRQRWPAGYTYTVSSDLELGSDPQHGPQLIGLRFEGLDIPRGARIEEAILEFDADGDQAAELDVTIAAEAAASPAPFEQDSDAVGGHGLSSRETGAVEVGWSPEPWTVGESYRSPDISAVLQQLVDRADWVGGPIVLLISPATNASAGFRSAVSSDESPSSAPRLLVRFTPPAAGDGDEPSRVPTAEPRGGRALIPEDSADRAAEEGAAEEGAAEDRAAEEGAAEDRVAEDVAAEKGAAEDGAAEETAEDGRPDAEQARPRSADQATADQATADRATADRATADQATADRATAEETPAGRAPADGSRETEGTRGDQRSAANAEDPRRARFGLHSDHARGVAGSVLLSDHGLGVTAITLFLEGVASGAEYPVSIHRGACGESSPALLELEPVSASRPFSTSIVPEEFDELMKGDLHLNVYRITEDFIRVAGCAQLGN